MCDRCGEAGDVDEGVGLVPAPTREAESTAIGNFTGMSSAANRIYTMSGADTTITARGSFNCIYDTEDDRWILLSINP